MSDLTGVNVGDPLVLVERDRKPEDVTVSRIGRKYLYVKAPSGREMQGRFHIDNGHADQNSGWPRVLYTPDAYADHQVRKEMLEKLSMAGVTFAWHLVPKLGADQLEEILAAVEQGS